MKHRFFIVGILVTVLVFGMTIIGCDLDSNDDELGGSGGDGGNTSGAGSTQENAISVTVGYSSSHSINSGGERWFRFNGTGSFVIFETKGNVVDTYIAVFEGDAYITWNTDDNSGAGYNALYAINTTSGITYSIKIETRSSTGGSFTFAVTTPTSNIRTNPLSLTVGDSSSHTIMNYNGQHWFRFDGTGSSIIFETSGDVVTTNIELYIGESTSAILTDNNYISFYTVSGTSYYIKITGNSGTYTLNARHGNGDGSSQSFAIPVIIGYSNSHVISYGGEQWFCFLGTGSSVTFKTTGSVVDTYIAVFEGNSWITWNTDDNSGDGSNAMYTQNTTAGTPYFIKIETRSGTSGSYSFVVE